VSDVLVNETPVSITRALSLLGLARRAGELVVGQDRVLKELRAGRALFVVTTPDCAKNVLRKIENYSCERRVLNDISRLGLGGQLGVGSAQIAALPVGSGFVKKIKELLK
jgi:ribosomal protein L7Ae-like RNA K-turn-binding protein